MPKLFFDTETWSEVPIKHGANAYAEQAEILLFAYALDGGAVKVWDVTADPNPPQDLVAYANDPSVEWWGHNAMQFDWVVIAHAMPWLAQAVPLARRFDTMIQAYAHSLPGGLESLCEVLGVREDQRKMKEGKALVRLFCIPPAKNLNRPRATRRTHPKEWAQFVEYARLDIVSMRVVHGKAPKWNYPNNPSELLIQRMDARMNMRGMAMDLELARAAVAMSDQEKKRLAARTRDLTGGEVESATKRDQMLAHMLKQYGVELPDLRASTLERRVGDPDLPEPLRELMAVRLQASMASVAKYTALLNSVNSDGRLRGTIQFCGAGRTGRWAHRGFQPGNLARVPKYIAKQWEQYIASIKTDTTELIADNVMEVVGSCVRGAIIAPPGKKLVVADLSNIEGRMLAWLAGEEWKLRAFREFDAGTGHDLYKLAYARAFGITPEEVDEYMRQVGKVLELALGYEGGVGAFITFAAAYGIDLDEMAVKALPGLPDWAVKEAGEFYDWTVKMKRSTFGLQRMTFVACDALKRAWRAAHPETCAFWKELGNAAVQCTNNPGVTVTVRRLKVRRDGAWLRIRLPSGRFLCYPSPQVSEDGKFSYMGLNQYSRKWERIGSYSGKLAENVTQAAARDQIAWGMLAAEDAGYTPITSIHDEAPTEVDDVDTFTHEGLSALLAAEFEWNKGLPLAAAGFESYRYKK